jgi:hypothetical protein
LGYKLNFDQTQFKATCSDSRYFEIGLDSGQQNIRCNKISNWCLSEPVGGP